MAPTIYSGKNFNIRQNRMRRNSLNDNRNSNVHQLNSNSVSLSKTRRGISTRTNPQINSTGNLSFKSSNDLTINNDDNNSVHSQSSLQSTSTSTSTSTLSTLSSGSSKSTPTFLLENNDNSNQINYNNEQSLLSPDLINQINIFNKNNMKINNYEKVNQFINKSTIHKNENEQTFSSEDNEVKMILQDKCSFETIKISSQLKSDKIKKNIKITNEKELEKKKSINLIEIALKTINLIRRNELLQAKLRQLQLETNQFIRSVMANPENQNVRNGLINQVQNINNNNNINNNANTNNNDNTNNNNINIDNNNIN